MPVFHLQPISETTLKVAVGLDVQLQEYLKSYLARTKQEQAEHVAPVAQSHEPPPDEMDSDSFDDPMKPEPVASSVTDDDIRF